MKKEEVLEKIGVVDVCELNRILTLNGVKNKITKFTGKYFLLQFPEKEAVENTIDEITKNNGLGRNKLSDGRISGWKVILCRRNLCRVKPKPDIRWNGGWKTNCKKLPHTGIILNQCPEYLHRGHLLAKSFFVKKLIIIPKYRRSPNNKENYTGFDSPDNLDNIYLQFRQSNDVQEEFETSVLNHFSKNQSDDEISDIYYEVQPIFLNSNDSVPIGNRILACDVDLKYNLFEKEYEPPFHVFIPNCDEKVRVKNYCEYGNKSYGWKDFFKDGDPRYLIEDRVN